MQIFLDYGHFLFIKFLLSLLIEGCLLAQKLSFICPLSYSHLNKNLHLFFVSLGIIDFESLNHPLQVPTLCADDHSLLVLAFYCELELDLLKPV